MHYELSQDGRFRRILAREARDVCQDVFQPFRELFAREFFVPRKKPSFLVLPAEMNSRHDGARDLAGGVGAEGKNRE